MIRKLLFAAIAALALNTAVVASAEARDLDKIISSGVLNVGVNPTIPPLAKYNEKNELVGFDVDFAQEIAKMLGVQLKLVVVGSADRIPFVTSGKIDFVMGAMTRSPERAKVIDFTVPAHTEVLGVLTTSKHDYSDWRKLNRPDVTFVEIRGSTSVKFIEDNLPKAKMTQVDSWPDAVRALAQGRGTAMMEVLDFMGEHTAKYPDIKWKVVENPINIYYCGLGVAKNSAGLRDWLNVAIFEIHRSGKTNELWKKWFGIDMLKPVQSTPYF